jgi:hypothetical protein
MSTLGSRDTGGFTGSLFWIDEGGIEIDRVLEVELVRCRSKWCCWLAWDDRLGARPSVADLRGLELSSFT